MFWIILIILFVIAIIFLNYAFQTRKEKYYNISIAALIVLLSAIFASVIPFKEKHYVKNLDETLAFDKNAPYKSMVVNVNDNPGESHCVYLEFASFNSVGDEMYANDYLKLTDKNVAIKFKKGKKNRIHYTKGVNCFGDKTSDYVSDVVIEYKSEK